MDAVKVRNKMIYRWLIACCFMIFAMAVIGAITRLTESGLSIVEWKPVLGVLPPMSEGAWQAEFQKYQATPEYIQKNAGMTLQEFKQIFFWEWLHRVWGRLIGIVFAVPFAFFAFRGWIAKADIWKYFGLLFLGGLQGFVGWFMVQSGLVDRPFVSHYRLALHLSLALLIFSLTLALAQTVLRKIKTMQTLPVSGLFYAHGWASLFIVSITIIWGAFVAGLDAGLIYNEFPKMGDGFLPPEMWHMSPAWINIFENHAAVQFTHRIFAFLSFITVLSFAVKCLLQNPHFYPALYLGVLVTLQVCLGIATLVSGVALPLATLHQAGALALLAGLIICLMRLYRSSI